MSTPAHIKRIENALDILGSVIVRLVDLDARDNGSRANRAALIYERLERELAAAQQQTNNLSRILNRHALNRQKSADHTLAQQPQ